MASARWGMDRHNPCRPGASLPRSGDVFAFHPRLAARADLLLPDGNYFLKAVDTIAGRLEDSVIAVRRRARDQDRGRLRKEGSNPLHDRNTLHDGPSLANLVGDLPHLGICHGCVGLVLEEDRFVGGRASGQRSYHAGEDRGSTGCWQSDPSQQIVKIDRRYRDGQDRGQGHCGHAMVGAGGRTRIMSGAARA